MEVYLGGKRVGSSIVIVSTGAMINITRVVNTTIAIYKEGFAGGIGRGMRSGLGSGRGMGDGLGGGLLGGRGGGLGSGRGIGTVKKTLQQECAVFDECEHADRGGDRGCEGEDEGRIGGVRYSVQNVLYRIASTS